MEIERRLKAVRERADFKAVHTCLPSSDVPDEQTARLVVLKPSDVHKAGRGDSKAVAAAGEILANRGNSPRTFRNMLAFVAPDKDIMPGLLQETRRYLAWHSVVLDADALNLDAHQRKQAAESEGRSNGTVNSQINEAYSWLLVPTQEGSGPVEWEATRIAGGSDSYVVKAAKKMKSGEQLIIKWSPALLRMELDKWLWREHDHVGMKKVWEILCTYNYLPRLRDADVLLDSIREGLRGRDYFAYATSVTEDGRYQGLQFGGGGGAVYLDNASVLVRPEAAEKQLEAENSAQGGQTPAVEHPLDTPGAAQPPLGSDQASAVAGPAAPAKPSVPTRFHGAVELDATRIGRDAGRTAEEVIQHLAGLVGARVKVTLEIEADVPEGVPDNVVRTVTENCRTLKFKTHGFEEV